MTPRGMPTNTAASVRARLLALSRARGEEFQRLLSDYAIERLLYRLSVSPHAERFVLKGAMLLRLWSQAPHRATWDVDLLGYGHNSVEAVLDVVRDLCEIEQDDGLTFDLATLTGAEIRAADEYAGVRVRLEATLAGAHIPMQVDVGFGDAIVPAPMLADYPTLLGHPVPRILAYPREAVVAEKLEAMVTLGITNSRIKDFFDIHYLANRFPFHRPTLGEAVRRTFERRGTPPPEEPPIGLTPEYWADPLRQPQVRAFARRTSFDVGAHAAPDLLTLLRSFLLPILDDLARGELSEGTWPPGGPWR